MTAYAIAASVVRQLTMQCSVTIRLLPFFAIACGGGAATEPTLPPPSPSLTVTGTWSGPASDDTGTGSFKMTLVQDGATVTGAMTANNDPEFSGGVAGSVSGRIFAGKWTGELMGCVIMLTFTAQFDSARMTGTYSGTNACSGSFGNGSFTLSKM